MRREYIVFTDSHNWGRGATIVEAMRNAFVTPQNEIQLYVLDVAKGDEVLVNDAGGLTWRKDDTKLLSKLDAAENLFEAFKLVDVAHNVSNAISSKDKHYFPTAQALGKWANDNEYELDDHCTAQ